MFPTSMVSARGNAGFYLSPLQVYQRRAIEKLMQLAGLDSQEPIRDVVKRGEHQISHSCTGKPFC
jgi:hypothetical protein